MKQSYVTPTGTTYPVLLGGNQIAAAYGTSKEDYLVIDGNGICTYRVKNYNQSAVEKALDDALVATDVPDDQSSQPENFNLEQNYPNPFNAQTTISFQIGNRMAQSVSLMIYDLQGKEVRTILYGNLTSGSYRFTWDGRNNNDENVASGVYHYLLQVGKNKDIKKMTLLR